MGFVPHILGELVNGDAVGCNSAVVHGCYRGPGMHSIALAQWSVAVLTFLLFLRSGVFNTRLGSDEKLLIFWYDGWFWGGMSSHCLISAGCNFGSHGLTMKTCVGVSSMVRDWVWTVCPVLACSDFSHVILKGSRIAELRHFISQQGSPLGFGFSLYGYGTTFSVRGCRRQVRGVFLWNESD